MPWDLIKSHFISEIRLLKQYNEFESRLKTDTWARLETRLRFAVLHRLSRFQVYDATYSSHVSRRDLNKSHFLVTRSMPCKPGSKHLGKHGESRRTRSYNNPYNKKITPLSKNEWWSLLLNWRPFEPEITTFDVSFEQCPFNSTRWMRAGSLEHVLFGWLFHCILWNYLSVQKSIIPKSIAQESIAQKSIAQKLTAQKSIAQKSIARKSIA